MKLLMLKLLTITALLSTSLYATKQIDADVLKYEKSKIRSILKRQNITLNDVSIVLKKELNQDNWYGYVFDLSFTVKGKVLTQKDTLFTNGTMITSDLINLKTRRSFKDLLYPTLSEKYFNKSHLIAGNADAPHTLVLFSDPLCPICIDEVPLIMKKVMENPEKIALYYYHMPLDMHPTAQALSKASMIATSMGIKDVDYTVYNTDFSQFYDSYKETDDQKALNAFNKLFKTNITLEQINDPKIVKKLQYDMDLSEEAFVNGTPTLFFDGQIDKSRTKYEGYLK